MAVHLQSSPPQPPLQVIKPPAKNMKLLLSTLGDIYTYADPCPNLAAFTDTLLDGINGQNFYDLIHSTNFLG